jgi:hypothetical protein
VAVVEAAMMRIKDPIEKNWVTATRETPRRNPEGVAVVDAEDVRGQMRKSW